MSIFIFAVLGYVTATLATFFVGRHAENNEGELAGSKEIASLRDELHNLRADIHELSKRLSP